MAYSGAYRGGGAVPAPPSPDRAADRESPARQPGQGEQPGPLSGALGSIFKKIEAAQWETDDLILALILYLMYRESGDRDLLIMLGAMLLS